MTGLSKPEFSFELDCANTALEFGKKATANGNNINIASKREHWRARAQ
jgi:hypothetical protein